MIKNPNTFDRGLFRGFIVPPLRHLFALITDKNYWRYHVICSKLYMHSSKHSSFVYWGKKRIYFAETKSFLSNLAEIFVKKYYDFGDLEHPPYIIDCGANIGLASIFLTNRYDKLTGICFEPDPILTSILDKNFRNWDVPIKIIQAALSNEIGHADFVGDGSDAGHLICDKQKGSLKVKTFSLRPYIDRKIDFLKIDIEGSEFIVLENIQDKLYLVDRIFVECHFSNRIDGKFSRVISILEDADFKLSFRTGRQPFVNWKDSKRSKSLLMETINIYGTRI